MHRAETSTPNQYVDSLREEISKWFLSPVPTLPSFLKNYTWNVWL